MKVTYDIQERKIRTYVHIYEKCAKYTNNIHNTVYNITQIILTIC